MRLHQFRLRTLMISIAFLALVVTVVLQTIVLRRAAVREELNRSMMQHFWMQAESYRRMIEVIQAQVPEQNRK